MDEHGDVLHRLHGLGTLPIDPDQRAADLTAMARVRPAAALRPKLRLAAAFLAGLLIGGSGLAAADALPDPAQHVAHTVLDRVGVDVPDPERYHGPECGPEVKRNHGGYVRDDHGLATSDCGKPVHAGQAGQDDDDSTEPDACRGKPPWAGDKTMTPDEKAAAQAERAARCGPDEDPAGLDADAGEVEQDDAVTEDSTTTTTEVPTTTTEATTTTEPTTTTG